MDDPDKIQSFDPKKISDQEPAIGEKTDIFSDRLFFSWYLEGQADEMGYYKQKIAELTDGLEVLSDLSEDLLDENLKKTYRDYRKRLRDIDSLKVPEGATLEQVRNGEVQQKRLDADLYKEEYDLWENCYQLCPASSVLQQMARSALDAYTVMLDNGYYKDKWEEILEYASDAIYGYFDLMFYQSSGESKLDCCYWIAKVFWELTFKMPEEYEGYKEHCCLMAIAFAEEGLEYLDELGQENHHSSDLQKILERAYRWREDRK